MNSATREGDRALADVAGILRAAFRETDVIARLGGDEFVVLALESPDVDTAAAVSRLEEQLNQFNHTHASAVPAGRRASVWRSTSRSRTSR